MAQDIAFRAGAALLEEDGSTWLVFEDDRKFIVTPKKSDHIWFETWSQLDDAYPELSRSWMNGGWLNLGK